MKVVYDSGWSDDLSIDGIKAFLPYIDVYTPNDKEARKLAGTDDLEEAVRFLAGYTPHPVVTLGKVEVYNKRGKPMPEGWTIDGAGQPCSDAHRMNESILSGGLGGILPLGGEGERTSGHKGYGLAIMVEALTGVLAQGMLSPEMCGAHGDHTSHFFMAFDPAMFGDPAAIRARMSGARGAAGQAAKRRSGGGKHAGGAAADRARIGD